MNVAERARLSLPEKIHLLDDNGFEGEGRDASVITPGRGRNPRDLAGSTVQPLGGDQSDPGRAPMASVKRLRILRDDFRNRRPRMMDEVMAIECTLHHFRCGGATGSLQINHLENATLMLVTKASLSL